jgi:hypothetical protein
MHAYISRFCFSNSGIVKEECQEVIVQQRQAGKGPNPIYPRIVTSADNAQLEEQFGLMTSFQCGEVNGINTNKGRYTFARKQWYRCDDVW